MAKVCECCGKKNNSFIGDPLYFEDDRILCYKCATPVKDELNQLYYAKSKEEFANLSKSIVEKSKTLFNQNIIDDICSIVKKRYNSLGFYDKIDFVDNIDCVNGEEKIGNNCATPNCENNTVTEMPDSTGMFSNIGSKIKTLAKVVTWIGIIASVISGIAMMSSGADMLVFVGIVVAILGSLLSWVSSFLLYGFGQLIENTDELVRNSKK